jgi:hypothetical protein
MHRRWFFSIRQAAKTICLALAYSRKTAGTCLAMSHAVGSFFFSAIVIYKLLLGSVLIHHL